MHPILFKIPLPHWILPKWLGGMQLHTFPIYAYGVMLGLSLVVGWYISLGLAKADGLPRETMANNYVFTAICAIIGSRILYIVTNLDEFHTWRDYFALRSGGLVAYGGFLGGFVGSWWYVRSKRVRLLAWADVAVPSLASGLLFTRIGCYLFGCDFGKKLPEKAPEWLKKLGTFPEWHYDHSAGKFLDEAGLRLAYMDANAKPQILTGSPAWVQHRDSDPIVNSLHHSLPVHPTQLYESLCGALLLATLWWARKSMKGREAEGKPFFRGELFLVFTFGYGLLRFLLEIVRDDAERGLYGFWMEPHVLYPVMLMVMALAFVFGLSNIFAENWRTTARVIAILIPLVVFFLMKPQSRFEIVEKVQLSTSQWIALLTGTAAAIYYRRGLDLAIADPATAADLGEGVPDLLEQEAALERGEDLDEWRAKRAAAAESQAADEGGEEPKAKKGDDEGDKKVADEVEKSDEQEVARMESEGGKPTEKSDTSDKDDPGKVPA